MLKALVFSFSSVGLLLAGCSTPSVMVKPGYYETAGASMPLEERYTGLGDHKVSSQTFASGEKQVPNYKVWYPSDMERSGKTYPLVLLVNGTGVTYPKFEAVFEHLASWGFIVAGNDDGWTALGTSTSRQLDDMVARNADKSSPFYRKIDTARIGIAGHSQGGAGTIHAVTDFPNGSRYRAMYTASAVSRSMIDAWKLDRKWIYDTSKIGIPYFMVAATGNIDSKTIAPLASVEQNFDGIGGSQLTVMARRRNVDHGNTLDHADGYMTAWFRYLLMGDQEARQVFVGQNAELSRNAANWQDVRIKGQGR